MRLNIPTGRRKGKIEYQSVQKKGHQQLLSARDPAKMKDVVKAIVELEKQTNPFLRTSSPSIRNKLGLKNASEVEVFSALRTAKDNF